MGADLGADEFENGGCVATKGQSISLEYIADRASKWRAMGGGDSDKAKAERIQEAVEEILFILVKPPRSITPADERRLKEILDSYPAGTVASCYVRVEKSGGISESPLLDWAVIRDHRFAIKLLVEAGADVNAHAHWIMGGSGETFSQHANIDFAIREKKFDVATDLYHLGAQISCLKSGEDARKWRRNNTQVFEDTLRADHVEFYKVLHRERDKQVAQATEEETLNEMESASILSSARCFDYLLGRALDKGLIREGMTAHVADLLAMYARPGSG